MTVAVAVRERQQLPRVSLPEFRGRIDRLLELLQAGEIPIRELGIAAVARQLLEQADDLSVDVAGPSLVIVATMVRMKTKLLLLELTGEAGQDLDGEDDLQRNRQDVREILLEVRELLDEVDAVDVERLPRETERRRWPKEKARSSRDPMPEASEASGGAQISLLQLAQDLEAAGKTLQVPQPFTDEQAMEEILERIGQGESLTLDHFRDGDPVRLLSGFLGALELLRVRQIGISQDLPFGEVRLKPRQATVGKGTVDG